MAHPLWLGGDGWQRDQIPFAAALALTGTAQAVQREIPPALDRELDRPVNFTKRGTFVSPARKMKLFAVVGY